MNHIIHQLCQIEEQSEEILNRAAKKQEAVKAEYEEKIRQFDERLMKQTEQKIAAVKAALERDCELQLYRQKKEADAYLSRLEDHYRASRETYVEQLFQQMTEV